MSDGKPPVSQIAADVVAQDAANARPGKASSGTTGQVSQGAQPSVGKRVLAGGGVMLAAAATGAGVGLLTNPANTAGTNSVPTSAVSVAQAKSEGPAAPAMNTLRLNLDGQVHMVSIPPLCTGFQPTFDTGIHIDTNNNQIATTIQGGQPSPGTIQGNGSFLTKDSFDNVKGVLKLDGSPQLFVINYTAIPGQTCGYNATVTFPATKPGQPPPPVLAGVIQGNVDLGSPLFPGSPAGSGGLNGPLLGLGLVLGAGSLGALAVATKPEPEVLYQVGYPPPKKKCEDEQKALDEARARLARSKAALDEWENIRGASQSTKLDQGTFRADLPEAIRHQLGGGALWPAGEWTGASVLARLIELVAGDTDKLAAAQEALDKCMGSPTFDPGAPPASGSADGPESTRQEIG